MPFFPRIFLFFFVSSLQSFMRMRGFVRLTPCELVVVVVVVVHQEKEGFFDHDFFAFFLFIPFFSLSPCAISVIKSSFFFAFF